MKSLTNILRRSHLSPRDRVIALVHNNAQKEKTGKNILSESEVRSISELWTPKNNEEVRQFNKYIALMNLESTMYMEAYMYRMESENALLRAQRVIDYMKTLSTFEDFMKYDKFKEYISDHECITFLIENTYLEIFDEDTDLKHLPQESLDDSLIISGSTLYTSKEDLVCIKEFREQIQALIPIVRLILFIRKYTNPLQHLATVNGFVSLAQDFSKIFDIDLYQKYLEHKDDYETQIAMLNMNILQLLKKFGDCFYDNARWHYQIGIHINSFLFEMNEELKTEKVINKYREKMKKNML